MSHRTNTTPALLCILTLAFPAFFFLAPTAGLKGKFPAGVPLEKPEVGRYAGARNSFALPDMFNANSLRDGRNVQVSGIDILDTMGLGTGARDAAGARIQSRGIR